MGADGQVWVYCGSSRMPEVGGERIAGKLNNDAAKIQGREVNCRGAGDLHAFHRPLHQESPFPGFQLVLSWRSRAEHTRPGRCQETYPQASSRPATQAALCDWMDGRGAGRRDTLRVLAFLASGMGPCIRVFCLYQPPLGAKARRHAPPQCPFHDAKRKHCTLGSVFPAPCATYVLS